MALSNEQFVDKLREIAVKKKVLNALRVQRVTEEKALVVEYKVVECNAARNTLSLKYADQMKTIQGEIKVLEESLGE